MATVTRDGVSIYYEQHGDAGDPVLLVMGLGVDAHSWDLQLPALAARHRVVLFDNRGAGRSSKPPGPYTTALLAGDALAVLDAAGFQRSHVVGLSMGGMIAQELVLAHPERVGALVLAATYARFTPTTGGVIERGRAALAEGDVLAVFRFLMPLVFSETFRREKREWLQAMFARSLGYGFSLDAFLGQVAAVASHDTLARLPSVRAPTLVVTGTADELIAPSHSEELARAIPGARLARIEGGTHGFNLEMPERFNEALLGFLAEHPLA